MFSIKFSIKSDFRRFEKLRSYHLKRSFSFFSRTRLGPTNFFMYILMKKNNLLIFELPEIVLNSKFNAKYNSGSGCLYHFLGDHLYVSMENLVVIYWFFKSLKSFWIRNFMLNQHKISYSKRFLNTMACLVFQLSMCFTFYLPIPFSGDHLCHVFSR